jgi:hypothetical protein
MGRPIKKKFFANLNSPYQDHATGGPTGLGGESVASVTVGGTNNNYSAFPTVTFAAPALPGTTATGSARVGVVSVSVTAAGTDYEANDVLTLVGGTGTAATITVNSVDIGGEILTFTVTTAGDYSALADLTDLAVTGGSGNDDATFTITALKINSIVVTEAGKGYTTVPAVTTSPSGNATLTAVLTTTRGNGLSVTVNLGAGAAAADIMKQASSARYLVRTAAAQGVCKLVAKASGSLLDGEMNLIATDSLGSTYYVRKLTARRALLTQLTDGGSGFEFATNARAGWTTNSASTGYVSVANV